MVLPRVLNFALPTFERGCASASDRKPAAVKASAEYFGIGWLSEPKGCGRNLLRKLTLLSRNVNEILIRTLMFPREIPNVAVPPGS
jgi:hypothetical protein